MSYQRAYHYTKFLSALRIVESGAIHRSRDDKNELEAVWFSTNPWFDYGSGVFLNRGFELREATWEMLTTKIGLARFSTDAGALMPYAEAIGNGLVEKKDCLSRYGAITDAWLIHPYEDFPLTKCTGAEVFVAGEWVEMTPENMEQLSATLPRVVGALWEDLFARKRRTPKKRKRKR